MLSSSLTAIVFFACAAGDAAYGQTLSTGPVTDNAIIERLLKRVDELERNQKVLQDRLATPVQIPPAATLVETSTRAEAENLLNDSKAGLPDSEEGHVLGPIQFRGFSDLGYGRALLEKPPENGLRGSPNGFTVGDFDLFVNSRITDKLSFLGELLITSDFTNNFAAELDRILLTYNANEYFKISAGKYNTAIGYYSNAFHRARYFQTATGRPLMFADEDNGGILPVHSIGVTATGKIPTGKFGLHYVAELANGRGSGNHDQAVIQNFVDENNGKAVNFALYATPEILPGLRFGASIYRDTMQPLGLGPIAQRITSAHIVFVRTRLEILNEAAQVRHETKLDHHVWTSSTMYSQVSYKVHKIRPFGRYDYQNVPESEPIFGFAQRRNGPSVGVRYDLADYAGIKLQYGRYGQRGLSSVNDFQVQLAFAF